MSSVKEQKPALSALLKGRGITSGQEIQVEVIPGAPGQGIVFEVCQGQYKEIIPALAANVVNTLRNVVLGQGSVRLCIVEHFLCAASLWGLSDLLVRVNGLEMPFADGSARIFTELFADAGWQPQLPEATIELPQPIICRQQDRVLLALPDDKFSISYHMDWDHPAIGKQWQSWNASLAPSEIADARTFGSLKEHQLLGIADTVVSLTDDGFSQPLRFPDEPVRHKLLDLLGDLTLSGVNPLSFKARFISIKAGHQLDVEMAQQLSQVVAQR